MSKFTIKNKFSVDPLVKGRDYYYQFNYTPKSVNLNTPSDCKTINLKFPDIAGDLDYDNKLFINMTLPLIEHKYRYCNMFEQLLRSIFYKDSHYRKPFSPIHTSNSYMKIKIHHGYLNGKFGLLGSTTRHEALYDYDTFISCVVDESALSIIGYSPKYTLFNTHSDIIIKHIFDAYSYEEPNVEYPPYITNLNEYVWKFANAFNIESDIRDIFIELINLVDNKQFDKFAEVFNALIDDEEPTTLADLNDNVGLAGFNDTDIHTNAPIHHSFFKALNATVDNVLLVPAKKSYSTIINPELSKKDPLYKRRLIDQYKVFFQNEDDMARFFNVYRHFTTSTSNTCLSTNVTEITENDMAYVHYFKETDATIIQDKIKNSTIDVEISNRKTPYWKDCYGFLTLNVITIRVDDSFLVSSDSEAKIKNYTDKVIAKLSKFDINGLKYVCNSIYSINPKSVFYVDGEVSAVSLPYSFYFNINDLRDDFSDTLHVAMDKTANNPYSSYMFRKRFSYMIGMVIPIIRDNEGYDHITRLLKRQKLTGNLGGFMVNGIVFAPYASKDQNEIDTLMAAIDDL